MGQTKTKLRNDQAALGGWMLIGHPVIGELLAVEEMGVEAALSGDPTMVYHAIAYDPLTAAVLSLAEIKKMVREMFRKKQELSAAV